MNKNIAVIFNKANELSNKSLLDKFYFKNIIRLEFNSRTDFKYGSSFKNPEPQRLKKKSFRASGTSDD